MVLNKGRNGFCEVCGNRCYGKRCFKHKLKKPIKKTPLKKSAKKATARGKTAHKEKRKSIKTLKNKLWMVFSKYTRLVDSDEDGNVKCFTSGETMFWREAQAGHFQSRRFNSTFIDERNVKPQSPYENCFLAGNQYVFGKRLDELYGEGTAEELVQLSRQNFKFTVPWLEEKYAHYSREVERLLKTKKFN